MGMDVYAEYGVYTEYGVWSVQTRIRQTRYECK